MPVPKHGPTCYTQTIPIRCSRCEQRIFFFQCTCGSRVLFDDLDTFERHDCAGAPLPNVAPPHQTRLHLTIRNSRHQPNFHREITVAFRAWDRAGVVLRTTPIRNHQFEIWLINSNSPDVLDQLANLFLAGFTIDSQLED